LENLNNERLRFVRHQPYYWLIEKTAFSTLKLGALQGEILNEKLKENPLRSILKATLGFEQQSNSHRDRRNHELQRGVPTRLGVSLWTIQKPDLHMYRCKKKAGILERVALPQLAAGLLPLGCFNDGLCWVAIISNNLLLRVFSLAGISRRRQAFTLFL